MANRERKNERKIYLSDKEQYILEQKVKISGMKSKSTFLRRLILYGFVYDIDYSDLREYNATLGKISGNLNQIAKRMNATGNVYKADVEEVKKLMKQVWDTQLAMLNNDTSIPSSQTETAEAEHGLGLKIVRQIVKVHYGDIQFSNITPHGLKTEIHLPDKFKG